MLAGAAILAPAAASWPPLRHPSGDRRRARKTAAIGTPSATTGQRYGFFSCYLANLKVLQVTFRTSHLSFGSCDKLAW
jgi:hypothetical protein